MGKRYFMFNDQKVDVDDIGAIQIIYDEHGMSVVIDLIGKIARDQKGMIKTKFIDDVDEDCLIYGNRDMYLYYMRTFAYTLTYEIARCTVDERGDCEIVDFRPLLKDISQWSMCVPFMTDSEASQNIREAVSQDFYGTYLKSQDLTKKSHANFDRRIIHLYDCVICFNHLSDIRIAMDDEYLALSFLGCNGSFLIQRYYPLCEYADAVNQYACEVVARYVKIFQYDPSFPNSALLLGDVIDNLQTIVFDVEDDQATKALIDEEFGLCSSESFILSESVDHCK